MPVQLIDRTPGAYAYPLLIKQLLHTPLAIAPEQEITYLGGRRHSYRVLRERIGRLASALAGLGIEAGHTVAMMDWDSHRYLDCFFAVPMMGAVLQTVNVRLSPEQILYTLNHARADVVLVNAEFLPILAEIAPRLESVRRFVLIEDAPVAGPAPVAFVGEYEALLAAASPDYDFPDFDENAKATTFYTTGTTGVPKGVYFSHRQLVLHTLSTAAAFGNAPVQGRLHRDDVYMPMTPMFHVHAWGMPYVATMLGLKQVYPGRYVPEILLKLIRDEGVTVSHCVPTILHMLLVHPLSKVIDLSRWKLMIGGSALSQALAKSALERGIDVFTGYGMSETCPILSVAHVPTEALGAPLAEQAVLRARTGRPMPLVDLRVVDRDLADLPHDGHTTGEVVVRSPWLTQGYLHNPEASAELWEGGVLHTGDIGHIDAEGFLQITDRIKDVIKTGGEWTSSLQIEDVVAQHPAVADVAVIGVPDPRWGERPRALVTLRPESVGQVSEHDIRNFAARLIESGGISRYGVLLQVQFVEALARTSVGKLNKRAMREAQE
ncbi:MAG: fatty acid--CoA ligase [Zoogloea oleivorans]|jgi:fatty-acyl-CoA synthase|uniref:fatty acid--CoA ligase n=1 Tax=Zoogloea oleivorans TaxID=1552750 RepID=UPI002A3648AB|nr:fatty acid--CoA ligase [Zoogloea oleivorans]MDY0036663.1 fatty acid--CoA ligase [Zoogloea oleivorans]